MSPKPTIHKNTKLPLTIFYTEKFQIKNGKICSASNNHIDKNDSPYMVEVLNANRISSIDRKGTLATRKITNVGSQLPKEIVAVVRARLSNPYETKESCVTNVVDKSLAMHLEVKVLDFVLDETSVTKMDEEARVIYNKIAMSCDKQRMQGLYCFNTKGNQLEHLLTQMGTYMFHFSLIGTKYGDVPATVLHVNIAPHNTLIPKHHVPQVLPRKKDFAKRLDISSQSNKNDEVKNEVENNDDNHLHPDKTIIHVTTLDELVQVNTWFAIAIFLGYAFSPPLPAMQVSTSLAPPRPDCYVTIDVYRNVVFWEIISFGFFLFSTMVAHGFKLLLVLGNAQQSIENTKTALVNLKFLQFGIWTCLIGTIIGSIFMIISLIYFVQVRLGSITCGNPWALTCVIIPSVLGFSGVLVFSYTLVLESLLNK